MIMDFLCRDSSLFSKLKFSNIGRVFLINFHLFNILFALQLSHIFYDGCACSDRKATFSKSRVCYI